MRRKFIRSMPILVSSLAAVLLGACQGKTNSAVPPEVTLARLAHVVAAARVEWPRVVSVPATVGAVDVAKLASRGSGRVTRVNVESGSHVAQGAILADVGIADARDQLAQAQANLATTQASYNEAAANEQRYASLYRTHVASAQQYDAMHRGFLAAKAQLAAATSALAIAKSNLNYAEIRAPFAGTIAEKNVKTGDFAAPGTALFMIAGDTPEIREQCRRRYREVEFARNRSASFDHRKHVPHFEQSANAAFVHDFSQAAQLVRDRLVAGAGIQSKQTMIMICKPVDGVYWQPCKELNNANGSEGTKTP